MDTTFDPDRSPKEAKMATGSLLNLTDAVITGRVKNGFALIRPPGHHAEPGYYVSVDKMLKDRCGDGILYI